MAGGLGRAWSIDAIVVRLAFVVLFFAGGTGLLLYALLWLAAPEEEEGAGAGSHDGAGNAQHAAGVGFIVLGMLVISRGTGLWFGDAVVGPIVLAALGSAVIYTRGDATERARWSRAAARVTGRPLGTVRGTSPVRLVAGALLVAGGMTAFLVAHDALVAFSSIVFAVAVTTAGAALIAGPWMWRVGAQLTQERRERIRTEERANMAAHLHDSVLQTLALIQRSGSSQEMVSLAHGQERELRAWLYGAAGRPATEHFASALEVAASRVEKLHHVVVEVVVVGDRPLDDRLDALIQAVTEAMTNAAKHSRAQSLSVYAEIEADAVVVYVRDQGAGFTPSAVPSDRGGIAHSITGRMQRYSGTATILSAPDHGTEVRLRMPDNHR